MPMALYLATVLVSILIGFIGALWSFRNDLFR